MAPIPPQMIDLFEGTPGLDIYGLLKPATSDLGTAPEIFDRINGPL